MNRKFSIIKILFAMHVERVHRKVYDNQFRQDSKITWKDSPVLLYYSLLFITMPEFRPYLKRLKPIILRAYQMRKLSMVRQLFTFWSIRKLNVERYSSYID